VLAVAVVGYTNKTRSLMNVYNNGRRKSLCVYMCGYCSVGITYGSYIYIYTYVDGCLVRWIVEDDADRSAAATKDIADLQLEDVRVVASSRYEDVLNGCKKTR
jgi:hypothetical protein